MSEITQLVQQIRSPNRAVQGEAFETLIALTDTPVDWDGDVWDELVADLSHADNRVRAIASQVLCNLAKSAPEERVLQALPALMVVTTDERFVTARHCLQSLWKIGVVGAGPREAHLRALTMRFADAAAEKNGTLVRSDIIESLRRVHDATGDEAVAATAQELIASETDDKYRRKYTKVWRR